FIYDCYSNYLILNDLYPFWQVPVASVVLSRARWMGLGERRICPPDCLSATMESSMISLKFKFHAGYPLAFILIWGILICGIVGSGISGCGKPGQSAEVAPAPQAFPVKVVTVQEQLVPNSTDYLATLKSRSGSVLQPQVEGQIIKILVHSGQRVEAGTPILEIDPLKQQATVSNQEANYKSKQATLELDRLELERRKQLYAAGVISRAELDQAQGAYKSAKADVDANQASIREQRVQLRYYTVNAPTSGMIGDIPVHVGDRVTSQTLVTTLDRGGSLEAYMYVPAEKSAAVRMGMPIDVVDEGGKAMLRTSVDVISPHVDTGTQTLL